MGKIIKIFLSVLVIIVLAIIVLPFVIPVDTMKDKVLAQIEKATGRKVTIQKLSLSLFPDIALKADDVSVSNPGWAAAGNMADIKELRLGVELMPLLHKQVNITELTLDSPQITLIKKGDEANWQMMAENASSAGKSEAAAKESIPEEPTSQSNVIVPSQITIKNGKLIYEDSQTGNHTVSDIELSLKAPHISEKAELSFSATIDGKKADIKLTSSSPLTIMQGHPSDIDTEVAYQDVKFTWQGSFALVNNRPDITGKLTLPVLDIPELSKETVNTESSTGTSAKNAPAKAPEKSGHWSDARIDLSGLTTADADLTIVIGKLVLQQTTLKDIQIATHLSHGALNVKTNDISAYDGIIKATVDAASTGNVDLSVNVNHVKAEPLLHDFASNDKLSGTLDATLKATTQGSSQRAMISALNGSGNFSLKDGKLKGVDIAGMIRNIATAGRGGSGQDTGFSDLSGTFTIKNGVVSNNDLKMDSPLLRVTGAGTADLPGWQVQYLLQPKLVASLQGQGGGSAAGLTIPIRVEGPLDNPRYRPDMQAALKSNLADPAKLKDTVNQLKGSLGSNLGGNLQNLLR